MRTIKAIMDGQEVMFLAEPDVKNFMAEQRQKDAEQIAEQYGKVAADMAGAIARYGRLTDELASVWGEYRKDLKNLSLLFTASGIINELAELTMEIRHE